jgi:hypothetical protein
MKFFTKPQSFLIFSLLTLYFSSYVYPKVQPSAKTINYDQIADKITMQFAAKMKQKKNLVFIGLGGAMMGDIQEMHVSFNYYSPLEIPIARKLIIECAQEYLKDINDNKEVQPYLHDRPFTAKNIVIVIFTYNANGSDIVYPKIVDVRLSHNTIYYLSDQDGQLVTIQEESYDEAVKIVEKEVNKK